MSQCNFGYTAWNLNIGKHTTMDKRICPHCKTELVIKMITNNECYHCFEKLKVIAQPQRRKYIDITG